MTEKEVCLMCENYSEDTKCDQHDRCKLMAVLKENRALKKKVSQLKLSVDHDDPGNGTEYNGCIMLGCDHPKYAKMIKKEILKYMKERKKEK